MTLILASRPNAYTGSPLDRASALRDDEGWIAGRLADPDSLFVPVWRAKTLFQGLDEAKPQAVFLSNEAAAQMRMAGGPWAFLGTMSGQAVFAVDVSAVEDPLPLLPEALGRFEDLRALAGLLRADDAAVLAHARGLMHWRVRHRFCGVCGAACEPRSAGNAVACTGCKAQHFPRTDPAVIMLVHRGDRVLLGHSQRFPSVTMYSTLAGFVEPGESLEEAVAREVLEESAIRVGRVTYHSSQPWPFPASIMLGFYAEALTDAITIDPAELRDARWFTRAELQDNERHGFSLPRRDSIARRLIEDWIEQGMTRWAVLAVLLAVSACAGARPATDQEQCERQADEDPVVRDMRMKAAGSPTYLAEEQTSLKAARQDALLRCLRARGIIRPGGVERQKPL